MNYLKLLLYIGFAVLSINISFSQIKLPAIISSEMVLQRNSNVSLWGCSNANEEIFIEVSWNNKTITTKADKNGKWITKVETNDTRGAQKIIISSKSDKKILENVLLGEVWLCSGQSNMGMKLKGNVGQPVFDAKEAVLKANNNNIRLFQVEVNATKEPLEDVKKYEPWQKSSSNAASNFSAVAYFFGMQLQEILGVPVGLIQTSRGGSQIQPWMSYESVNKFEKIDLSTVDVKKDNRKAPTLLFNAMVNPLIPYTIKGTIWYQGESNRLDPEQYKTLFPEMVKDWRNRWGQGKFPFYFVQIAPFKYKDDTIFDDVKNSAFQREAQLQSVKMIPNSEIVITADVGDENFIHPPKKKPVADRLLYHALNKTYGMVSIAHKSPVYSSFDKKNQGLLLKFDDAENGLFAYGELTDFEIAGEDKVFYPAEASLVNRKDVFVKSNKVLKPVAVRYGWRNYFKGTLFGTNLLPVSSFRTDTWTEAKRTDKK